MTEKIENDKLGSLHRMIAKKMEVIFWLLTLFFIFLTSLFGRRILSATMQKVSEQLLAAIVFITFVGAVLMLWRKRELYQLSSKKISGAVLMLIFAGGAVYWNYLHPIETVHFLIFSWFGWISSGVWGPLYGAGVVFSIGVGDEVLQHFLPDRVGDLRDVVINLLSGFAGLLLRLKW